MTEDEFRYCYYIDKELRFYTYKEFCKNAHGIKRQYEELKCKIFYKWYVYANIHISNRRKDKIWEYLNDDIDYVDLLNCL